MMPNPHGDPMLKQPLMKLQPQAYDILFGKPGYVYMCVSSLHNVNSRHRVENAG